MPIPMLYNTSSSSFQEEDVLILLISGLIARCQNEYSNGESIVVDIIFSF
jgi:hypothetical protein